MTNYREKISSNIDAVPDSIVSNAFYMKLRLKTEVLSIQVQKAWLKTGTELHQKA